MNKSVRKKFSLKQLSNYFLFARPHWGPLIRRGGPYVAPWCSGAPGICLGCPALSTALIVRNLLRISSCYGGFSRNAAYFLKLKIYAVNRLKPPPSSPRLITANYNF